MKYNDSMPSQDTDLEIYQHMMHFTTLCRQRLAKIAEPLQLTGAQLQMLISIQPNTPTPMKHLCLTLLCDPSHVTNIIERLVGLGLIKRHEAPEDRRIKIITLTQKGERVRALVIADFSTNAPSTHLNNQEKQQLHTLCEKMTNTT